MKEIEMIEQYLKHNLVLIPCAEKIPCIPAWPKRNVTPSMEEIEEWDSRYQRHNWGLVMGRASTIIGVDIDGNEAYEEFCRLNEGCVSKTWEYLTPSGGRRLLYRVSKDAPLLKKWRKSFPGNHAEIAFMGDGQQTILPPSVLSNGSRYEWLQGQEPWSIVLAPAPEWILQKMTSVKTMKIPKKTLPAEQEQSLTALLDCKAFSDAYAVQQENGLPEEEWFRWISFLVNSRNPDLAHKFSALSRKHNMTSERRLKELIGKSNESGGPLIRCTTFGCSEKDVHQCFTNVKTNELEEITNSPGGWLKQNKKFTLTPKEGIFTPYTKGLYGTNFLVDQLGHLNYVFEGKNPIPVANFIARITEEISRDDGIEVTREIRIAGILEGNPLPVIDIPISNFKSMNWVCEKWGIKPSIRAGYGNQDRCREAIQAMSKEAIERQIFTHTGWCKLGNAWCYLHRDGAIGADHVEIELDSALKKYAFTPLPEATALETALCSFDLIDVAPRKITIPLLAVTYLAVLCEPLKQAGIEPSFVVWLYGGTGTRKTSLGMLFLSHFGVFGIKSPPASFKDTPNAVEKKAFAVKDALLLIDDFHPEVSSNETTKMNQTAQRVLRIYGDRIGRGRLKATTETQREYLPRGMALVTGEDFPLGESSIARFIGIELQAGNVNLEQLSIAQEKAPFLNAAMHGFIYWLSKQFEEMPKELKKEFQEYRSQYQRISSHGRIGEAAAWLQVAFNKMIEYMLHVKACSPEDAGLYIEEAEEVFTDSICNQNYLVQHEKPADIFINVISELLSNKSVVLTKLPQNEVTSNLKYVNIGWYDDAYFYLLPETTYNTVEDFLSKRHSTLSITPKTLWKHLDEGGWIDIDKDSGGNVQRLKKKFIKTNFRPRLLHIRRAKFDGFLLPEEKAPQAQVASDDPLFEE